MQTPPLLSETLYFTEVLLHLERMKLTDITIVACETYAECAQCYSSVVAFSDILSVRIHGKHSHPLKSSFVDVHC